MNILKKVWKNYVNYRSSSKKRFSFEVAKFLVTLLVPLAIVFVTSQQPVQQSIIKAVNPSADPNTNEVPREFLKIRADRDKYFKNLDEHKNIVKEYLNSIKNDKE